MAKLTEVMRRSLAAISLQGGVAIAEGGGWWKGGNGVRLMIDPATPSVKRTVGTTTIYALEDRGMLERANSDLYYRATRRITEAGRAALSDSEGSEHE